MNIRNYKANLQKNILRIGVQAKIDLTEQCRREHRDVSKHEYVQLLEDRALKYLREVSTMVNNCYWEARKSVDSTKQSKDKKMMGLAMIDVSRSMQSALREMRRQVCDTTRKTLEKPDTLQEAVKVVYVRDKQTYSSSEVAALLEMANDFGVDVNL